MICVAALYRFARLADPASLRDGLLACCRENAVRGTLLLATEGVNGTIAGSDAGIAAVVAQIRAVPGCDALDVKYSQARKMPFHRLKVRVKKEIVTFGVRGLDPAGMAGTYVEPEDWNALISDPDTLVIDTRNRYEVEIGSFAGALDPGTDGFAEFPAWFEKNRHLLAGKKRVAMFCTGGIRCEKSTAFLRQQGVEDVFHLRGGILKYLETIPAQTSLWKGECFVFDERVAVGHGLAPGSHVLCRACRMPVSPEERAAEDYVEGERCPKCSNTRSDDDRRRYAERHRQVGLAAARGRTHVGARPGGTRSP